MRQTTQQGMGKIIGFQRGTGMPIREQVKVKIAARWGGKCALCQCKIPPGDQVMYTPSSVDRVMQRPIDAQIEHLPGECGSVYSVHAIFQSTRVVLNDVAGYTAHDALDQAPLRLKQRGLKPKGVMGWEVRQGGVVVLAQEVL